MGTKIEWTNAHGGYKGETWNPVAGCSHVSEGCQNCYAQRLAPRVYHGADKPFRPRKQPSQLGKPLHWGKARFVFVVSMGDLFHEQIPDHTRDAVFGTIEHRKCRNHIFAILTKRAGRMREYMTARYGRDGPPENVWLGVTAENQRCAEKRVPELLRTPAAVRFVSCEPLLGEVNLRALKKEGTSRMDALEGMWYDTAKDVPAVDWVLCGGESGPGARPMHPRWARGLRDQCTEAGVPYFFKQWGRWAPYEQHEWNLRAAPDDRVRHWNPLIEEWREGHDRERDKETHGQVMVRVGKKEAGRELDGETWDQVPKAQ